MAPLAPARRTPPPGRGGARAGSGRKPCEFKDAFNNALQKVVTQEDMEALVRALLREAQSGNVKAAALLLDRCLGKVPQAVQVSGEEGPIEVVVTFAR